MFWSVNVKIRLIFQLFDFFARITLDIVTYDVFLGNGLYFGAEIGILGPKIHEF